MMLWHVAVSFQKMEMSDTTHSLPPFNPSLSTSVKLIVDGWTIVKEQQIKFTLPRVSFKDILSKLTTLRLSLFPDKKFHCPVIRVDNIGIVTPETCNIEVMNKVGRDDFHFFQQNLSAYSFLKVSYQKKTPCPISPGLLYPPGTPP